MKNTFSEMLHEVWEASQLFIEKSLNEGEVINLHPIGEDDEEDNNYLYELPFVFQVGKYGNYDEYAILSVTKEKGEVILHTQCKGENSDICDFTLPEIDHSNMCFLADEISKLKIAVI